MVNGRGSVRRSVRGVDGKLDDASKRSAFPLYARELDPCSKTEQPRHFFHAKHPASHNFNPSTMSRSTDPGHFFQTDASESTRARRAAKSGNKNGDPVVLQSKILSVIPDPFSPTSIYTAESAGCVRKVNLEVGTNNTMSQERVMLISA